MARIFGIFLVFALLAGAPGTVRAEDPQGVGFFQMLPDVPVMPGLTEQPGEAVVFDQPDGRIAEAAAAGYNQNLAQVKSFYNRTLPQLGWQAESGDSFHRDGEKLTVTYKEGPGGLVIVRFRIEPYRA